MPLLPLCSQIYVGATVNSLLWDTFSPENNTHGSRLHDRDPQFASRILGAMTQSCYIGTRDIRSRVIRGPYCIYIKNLLDIFYNLRLRQKKSQGCVSLPWKCCPIFIQYFARNWPRYSLRGLHIRIIWFSLYGIRIPLFPLYGIHMPLFPYMVILPIILAVALLWAAMDFSLSQGPLLWRHNDMTVIVSRNTRGRERDTRQRLDNANARRLQTFNR